MVAEPPVRAGPPLSRGKISSKPLALSTRKPCCALGAARPGPVASSLRQGYWAARGAARGAQQRGAPLIQNRPSCNGKRAQRWCTQHRCIHSTCSLVIQPRVVLVHEVKGLVEHHVQLRLGRVGRQVQRQSAGVAVGHSAHVSSRAPNLHLQGRVHTRASAQQTQTQCNVRSVEPRGQAETGARGREGRSRGLTPPCGDWTHLAAQRPQTAGRQAHSRRDELEEVLARGRAHADDLAQQPLVRQVRARVALSRNLLGRRMRQRVRVLAGV